MTSNSLRGFEIKKPLPCEGTGLNRTYIQQGNPNRRLRNSSPFVPYSFTGHGSLGLVRPVSHCSAAPLLSMGVA